MQFRQLKKMLTTHVRRTVAWFGPFSTAIVGMFLLMAGVAVSPANPQPVISIIGGLMIMSAMELSADRAEARKDKAWASFIWEMLSDSNEKTFTVMHTFPSIRPELDAAIAEEVAKAMSASGQDQNAASAVGETDLP